MNQRSSFSRRGIAEGFFGPLWSMAQRTNSSPSAPIGIGTLIRTPRGELSQEIQRYI